MRYVLALAQVPQDELEAQLREVGRIGARIAMAFPRIPARYGQRQIDALVVRLERWLLKEKVSVEMRRFLMWPFVAGQKLVARSRTGEQLSDDAAIVVVREEYWERFTLFIHFVHVAGAPKRHRCLLSLATKPTAVHESCARQATKQPCHSPSSN